MAVVDYTIVTFGATGVLLLVCFVVAERRSPAPLVPLRVFATRAVIFPNESIFLQSMIGLSRLYVLTLYFQDVLGYGPLVAARLTTRFGVKPRYSSTSVPQMPRHRGRSSTSPGPGGGGSSTSSSLTFPFRAT